MRRVVLAKVWRCARQVPRVALGRFLEPIFNASQMLTFAVAVIGLAIILRTATPSERDMQAEEWAIAIQAFGYALVAWAVISLVSAPFLVVRNDRAKGRWHGPKFIYHEPLLVATIPCSKEIGDSYEFRINDAEDDSFVYCTVQMDRPEPNVVPQVGGDLFLGNPPTPGSWSEFRLRRGKMATLRLHIKRPFHDFTARVYCHQFEVLHD